MVDLTSIDRTLAAASDPGHCACGCGEQISPAGPDPWFASEACQQIWNVTRGRRTAAAGAPRSPWSLPETPADRDRKLAAATDFQLGPPAPVQIGWAEVRGLIVDLVAAMRQVVRRIGEALVELVRELTRHGLLPDRSRRKPAPPASRRRQRQRKIKPPVVTKRVKAAPHRYKRDYRH